MIPAHWITPDWQPHPRVRACVTTRTGEHSPPPWAGFNLGTNCGDEPSRVEAARTAVHQALGTEHAPAWLVQVHGTHIVEAQDQAREADGVVTHDSGRPCVVLTADCLPVLLARVDGSAVAALHAGWRGLLNGILEAGAARLAPQGEPLSAWLGPAICARCYQVDDPIRDAFLAHDTDAAAGFIADGPGHWRMDLVVLARQRLAAAGVTDVHGGDYCTHCRADLFYSFRYEGQTGRFATLIWLNN